MFAEKKFVTEHTCEVKGQKISYRATVENFFLYDREGEKEASMYTFAYERCDIERKPQRPVLFAYNGGPGGASAMINFAALAPERVKVGEATSLSMTPPYEVEENTECILDICDIVTIDPIETGYSRLLKAEAGAKYFNTESDCRSFVKIIAKWLDAHERWNSPVYLMGESYGTIRNAMLAGMLSVDLKAGCNYVNLSGIIMLGSAFDHGQKAYPIDTPILNFTAVAATYWYHHQSMLPARDVFLKEADRFAYEEYLPALALGRRLREEKRTHIKERLTYFTGLDEETLEDLNLRVDTYNYPAYGLRKEGKVLGRYDGRFTMEAPKGSWDDLEEEDMASSGLMSAVQQCFNSIWKKKLHIDLEDAYRPLCFDICADWDFSTSTAPIKSLAQAMKRIPNMKLMLGCGYYDLLTTMGFSQYTLDQFNLPAERVRMEYFETGHMPYLGSKECDALGRAVRAFIEWN